MKWTYFVGGFMWIFTEEGINIFTYLIHTHKLNSCVMGRGREGGREGGKERREGERENSVHQTTHF